MDVFLLGAGRPAHGKKPSALKNIALNTKAIDWQIHSFESIAELNEIHYLGGYHIDEVVESYPQINYCVIPDWQYKSVLHTFLKAPFTDKPVISAYSDTIFRKEVVLEMLSVNAEVVFCVDSLWKERFYSRPLDDIKSAETIEITSSSGSIQLAEFTGLICFKSNVVNQISSLSEAEVGSSIIDLIKYLDKEGFSVKPFDITGRWAEFNSPYDIAHFILGTKAETLKRLEPVVRLSHIGKQVSFTCEDWYIDSNLIIDEISHVFGNVNLVVRSSSISEDGWFFSNAGGYESILNINGGDKKIVYDTINKVIASYGDNHHHDQVLVQEFLNDVNFAGVVFTCSLESGAPYYRFNFDDKTQSTESVTAGTHSDLRTVIVSRFETEYLELVEPKLMPVLLAIEELEKLLGFDKLDVEFAVGHKGEVYILQVRPITVDHSDFEVDAVSVQQNLLECKISFNALQIASPFVFGDKCIFANMPDWNPAEIIGTRPKPLAFSLYQHLITNQIWAQQRAEYGYRDVRPCPLIRSFSGQPYVDSRASFNSFIPENLPDDLAERLVKAYINILSDNPQFHDKIEFKIAFTVWIPGFYAVASSRLIPYGVTSEDIIHLEKALKVITKKALVRLDNDITSVKKMTLRRKKIISSRVHTLDKLYTLLDDCKRFGTLAFAHSARAGFVATTLLNSFVEEGIISNARRLLFLRSIKTVASEIEYDKYANSVGKMSDEEILNKYGHLRPGTYEISAHAYWENPKKYLFSEYEKEPEKESTFLFTELEEEKLRLVLHELGAPLSVDSLITYLIKAIQKREWVKFEFTRNLSISLDLCVELGREFNLSREDLSYLIYSDLEQLKLNMHSIKQLSELIELRKQNYILTRSIELPSLIKNESDFFCFERFTSQPNFVTDRKIEAIIQIITSNVDYDLKGKLVLIPQADPGYDWLFSHNIAGLITQYGGANSHMAIRAAEIGLPAAIGVGEKLYERITCMKHVELDCSNHVIREII